MSGLLGAFGVAGVSGMSPVDDVCTGGLPRFSGSTVAAACHHISWSSDTGSLRPPFPIGFFHGAPAVARSKRRRVRQQHEEMAALLRDAGEAPRFVARAEINIAALRPLIADPTSCAIMRRWKPPDFVACMISGAST